LQTRAPDAGSLPRVSAAQIEGAVRDALRAATPNGKLSEATIRAGIEKVVVGKSALNFRWRDAEVPEAPTLNLCVPWSPAPTRRQREILQGDGSAHSDVRPMRMEARRAFAAAYGKASRWLELLTDDSRTSISSIAVFLDPALVEAALVGRLPRDFGLKRTMDLPAIWSEQWIALGAKSFRHRRCRRVGSGDPVSSTPKASSIREHPSRRGPKSPAQRRGV